MKKVSVIDSNPLQVLTEARKINTLSMFAAVPIMLNLDSEKWIKEKISTSQELWLTGYEINSEMRKYIIYAQSIGKPVLAKSPFTEIALLKFLRNGAYNEPK